MTDCTRGQVDYLSVGSVGYVYYCVLDTVEVTYDNVSDKYNVSLPFKVMIKNVSGTTPVSISGEYARVFSRVYEFDLTIPRDAWQGLYTSGGDNYYFLNILYIYVNISYRDGKGQALVFIVVTISIDGVNLTNPYTSSNYTFTFWTNSDLELFYSAYENPVDPNTLLEKTSFTSLYKN